LAERAACLPWPSILYGNILSEDRKIDLKNANIGIAVTAAILAVGFIPLHDSKGASEALAAVALAAGFAVLFILDWRDDRAQRNDADPPA
jgi:hypothetical protein